MLPGQIKPTTANKLSVPANVAILLVHIRTNLDMGLLVLLQISTPCPKWSSTAADNYAHCIGSPYQEKGNGKGKAHCLLLFENGGTSKPITNKSFRINGLTTGLQVRIMGEARPL